MKYITRINLKTRCHDRKELIDFCLNGEEQCLAMGWSYIYDKETEIKNFEEFYDAVKKNVSRINHVFNVFLYAKKDDLFWTRDLEGNYWICRVKEKAQIKCDYLMDIGAILPIEAYKVGMQVPGQIKASFNRPRGGTAEGIYDEVIIEYSKHVYNTFSGTEKYYCNRMKGDILENLPDFQLEELVIAYLQIDKNFYLLSNSIANKSTTIKIECELMSRDKSNKKKAVVQVKGGKNKIINALDYKVYVDDGYEVYLYAPKVDNVDIIPNCKEITKEELLSFYNNYKTILPDSITRWEDLFV